MQEIIKRVKSINPSVADYAILYVDCDKKGNMNISSQQVKELFDGLRDLLPGKIVVIPDIVSIEIANKEKLIEIRDVLNTLIDEE